MRKVGKFIFTSFARYIRNLLLASIIVCLVFTLRRRFGRQRQNLTPTRPPRPVTILMWTAFYNNRNKMVSEVAAEAPLPPWCTLTFDRSLLAKSDAVVFHGPGTEINLQDLPKSRSTSQIWVFFSLESPAYMDNSRIEKFNDLHFNRTLTYRFDSDFHNPYGRVLKREESAVKTPFEYDFETAEIIKGKTKTAAFMASHCNVQSGRDRLVKSLQKYISVDTFGACGTQTCDQKDEIGCYVKLGKTYKFYMSMENSHCTDYITEKFFNALYAGMVPVAFGGGNYTAVAPYDKMFINANDFENVQDLGEYLKYLDNNPVAYEAYFEWRKLHSVYIRQYFVGFQRMCRALQLNLTENRSYENFKNWWSDNRCDRKAKIHF